MNPVDQNEYNPLHVASLYGFTGTTKYLIMQGADVNAHSLKNRTALGLAAREEDDNTCYHLMTIGANVVVTTEKGVLPLHSAASHCGKATVTCMLHIGCSKGSFEVWK